LDCEKVTRQADKTDEQAGDDQYCPQHEEPGPDDLTLSSRLSASTISHKANIYKW
jgi:hypothetical protein